MKSLIAALMLSIFCCINASAADTSAAAKKILDKAAAKVSLKSGTQMGFTITGDKIGKQSGTITIKGKKFNARTGNAIVWFDGTTQWTYLKKNEEVNVSTPNAAQQSQMNPYSFINLYKSGYNLSLEKTASGNQVHLVAQKNQSIKEMFILVDASNNIKQVKMKQKAGWTTITISSVKSVNVNDSAFKFNASDCPNAEVIDLR